MATRYDFPQTPEQTKNTARVVFRNVGGGVIKEGIYRGKIADVEKDDPLYMSTLNTPVMSNFETKGGTYTVDGATVEYPALKFDTVVFTVGYSKNIVVTPVQGRNGTVKEYISDKDYLITIKGLLTGGNHKFPMEDFRKLKQAIKAPVSIEVLSWYLKELDIYNIIITDVELPQDMGRYSQVPFTIMALSDEPVELKVK